MVFDPANAPESNPNYVEIRERSTTTGTGDIALSGAISGFAPFSDYYLDGEEVQYSIDAVDGSDHATGQYETGIGIYNAEADTITRSHVADNGDGIEAEIDGRDPTDFSAGNKIVSSVLQVPAYVTVSDTTGLYDSPATVKPTGRLQLSRNVTSDMGAAGTSGNTVFYVPIPLPGGSTATNGKIRIFTMRPDRRIWGTREWYEYDIATVEAGRQITQVNQTLLSVRLNIPSQIPFEIIENTTLPLSTRAGIPADIFIWKNPDSARPFLFYMNWYDAYRRNNGTVGFDLSVVDGVPCWSSAWMRGGPLYDRFQLFYNQQILYLGTVLGDSDGTCVNSQFSRGLWNYWNRIKYTDTFSVNAMQWDVPWERVQLIGRMGGGLQDGWQHKWVAGEGYESANIRFGLRISSYGPVAASMYEKSRESNNWRPMKCAKAEDDIETSDAISIAELNPVTDDRYNNLPSARVPRTPVENRFVLNNRITDGVPFYRTEKGVHVVSVCQRGADRQRLRARFFGQGVDVRRSFMPDPNIRFAMDDNAQQIISGPCEFVAKGEA